MNLIIVESPTKAQTLSRFLGNSYSVEATMGHIKDLPKSRLGVDIENNFEPDYKIVEKRREIIKKIKLKSKNAEKVFLATDPDREGEAIAKHLQEIIIEAGKQENKKEKEQTLNHSTNRLHNLKRIVFHEITKQAVEEAIENPREINRNLVDAQLARRVLDRLVGYKLSPLLWKKVRRGLSAGRVQSVALRLIVEKEREIEAFKSQEFWGISAVLSKEDKILKVSKSGSGVSKRREKFPDQLNTLKFSDSFVAKLIKVNSKKVNIESKEQADEVVFDLKRAQYKVFNVDSREVIKNPYPPFTTSTMTQAAARVWGWSAKKTMALAQTLYEEGLITYHRTDSVNLAFEAVSKVREFIRREYGEKYLPKTPRSFKKTSKLAQEAHEAIRPTDLSNKYKIQDKKYQKDAEKLYNLIRGRFIACQMAACVFDETTIDTLASVVTTTNNYLLRTFGRVMKFDGWRKVIPLSKDETPKLPIVEKNELLNLIKVISEQKFTQPPPRYNEASLIKTLEKLGIGRPSTYAPIITTIQTRSYVEKVEGKFKPTPVGIAVSDFLVTNFPDIVDYSFTAEMEDELDDIAKGNLKWRKMMKTFYNPFSEKINHVEKNSLRVKIESEKLGKKCPTCEKEGRTGGNQGELVVRTGRFGRFISCSNFPECKHTERYIEKIEIKCPECKKGDVIVRTTKMGKRFYGCSRYPSCKWASWRKPFNSLSKNLNA